MAAYWLDPSLLLHHVMGRDRPELWRYANELATSPSPSLMPTFIRRDYHPANTLWCFGRPSGVMDSANSCNGPTGNEVAYCLVSLSALFGLDATDAFLTAYEHVAGVEHHLYWDLLDLLDVLDVLDSGLLRGQWDDAARTELTNAVLRRRVEAYLRGSCDDWGESLRGRRLLGGARWSTTGY